MPELQNILWMSEELDFQVQPGLKAEAKSIINQFLGRTANPSLRHWIYRA